MTPSFAHPPSPSRRTTRSTRVVPSAPGDRERRAPGRGDRDVGGSVHGLVRAGVRRDPHRPLPTRTRDRRRSPRVTRDGRRSVRGESAPAPGRGLRVTRRGIRPGARRCGASRRARTSAEESRSSPCARSTRSPGRSSGTTPKALCAPWSTASKAATTRPRPRDGSSLALAGGLRARLGDPEGAVPLLREAVILCRDQGARPSLAAALDWSLAPLVKLGHPGPAATFIGALSDGPLAEVSGFPEVDAARARILERIRAALGDETTDERLAQGAGDDVRRDRRVRARQPRARNRAAMIERSHRRES